jgi:hypothetical protein
MEREMQVSSLEEMCDLMCGTIEEDYEEERMIYMTKKEIDMLLEFVVTGNTFETICDELDKTDYCANYGCKDEKECILHYLKLRVKKFEEREVK